MVEIKKLSGILNKDDKEENISPTQHIDALNVRFYGGANGLTAENIVGNALITNPYKPAGDNECIGGFYDGIKQRVIWGNWNSNNRHGIYQYSILTKAITPLLICFTDSQTDILGFDRDYPMCDADIIYTTEDDGDIFGWNCRNKRPKCLNIKQAENNLYGSNWLEKYLDVAKEPPYIPPKSAYEDDATVTVNNLRKKLFKPKYRFWYADNQKTTWSSHGEIPVPFNYTNPETDTDETKNCRIGILVQTGDESVTKIEIAIAESLGNVFSNFFSVIILDKAELGIPDNDVYLYRFYNDEAYDYVDLKESILLFDRVPDKANAQALLNGNVRAYGGITEGLDPVVPDVSFTLDTQYPLAIPYTVAFLVTQYGTNGFVTGEDIKFSLVGNVRRGQQYTTDIRVGATLFTITFLANVGDTTSTVLAGLSLSATTQGFTQVSISANELVISRTNQSLERFDLIASDQAIAGTFNIVLSTNTLTISNGAAYLPLFYKGVQFIIYGSSFNYQVMTVVSSVVAGVNLSVVLESVLSDETIGANIYFINPLNSSIPAYNSSSKEGWSLFYFEDKGKSNGATTKYNFNVSTLPLGLSISVNSILYMAPYINAEINHRPPLWATSYQWGRTANLTKQDWLYWISSATYKDDKYAYISIESIKVYKRLNPNSVISYDFLPGDRIKFYVLYDQDGNPVRSYGNEHDYEIYDVLVNPEIYDIVKTGTFVKIVLPTVDALFNFGTNVVVSPSPAQDFNNYYIELYTPAKAAAEGLELYYEFSEEFAVIDAGTANRRHQGQLQNQSSDLVTPATFKFNKGDAWYRTRAIQTGNVIIYDLVPGSPFGTSTILGQRLRSIDFINPEYTIADSISQQQFINNFLSPGWTINVLQNTYTYKVKGIITLRSTNSTSIDGPTVRAYVVFGTSTVTYTLGAYGTLPIGAGTTMVMNVNTNIIMPPNSKVFIVMNSADGNFRVELLSGFLTFTEPQKEFIVGVVDKNFSDFYESKVNSNGRAQKVNPDEKTNFFGTMLRYGNPYQQNTNLNQINRFYDDDFDEADRSKGDIQRLKARDKILRAFFNRAVGQYGIRSRFIQNNQGDIELISTDELITKGNINYYLGEHGLGTQYTSLVSNASNDYFPDVVTGDDIRLDGGGFTPIGQLYKGQYFLRRLLTPYNKPLLRQNGATAKILGCYDYFDEQRIMFIQGGTDGTTTTDNYCLSFNESRNGYCSPYSYNTAEWIMSAEDLIVSFKDGDLWLHNNTTQRCNFFGVQYDAYITLVFNMNLFEKKTWGSISELASAVWRCPLIYSNVMSYGTQRQETNLVDAELLPPLEGMFHSAFKRDIHSRGGKVNGDFMKGNYLVVKFFKENASDLITLSEAQIEWMDSPLTNK